MNNLISFVKKNLLFTVVSGIVVITVITSVMVAVNNNLTKDTTNQVASEEQQVDETGWIYVDGGDGTLSDFDGYGYSYIGESARGTEAYLAEKAVTANYDVTAEKSGTYRLQVSLSDDAIHDSGARDASIAVNGVAVVFYKHTSEDTKGWKWYTIGNISLKAGFNKIAFTKDETTSAAYVMDQFRLIPQV